MIEHNRLRPGVIELHKTQAKQLKAKERLEQRSNETEYFRGFNKLEDEMLVKKKYTLEESGPQCDGLKYKITEYLTERLMLAVQSLNFDYHAQVIKDLPDPSKLILMRLSEQRAFKTGIKFYQLRTLSQKSLATNDLDKKYSIRVLKDCILKMEIMGMVHISRKPFGDESTIVLLIPESTIEQMVNYDKKKACE